MRRPNPWVAVPILLSAIAGGVIGFIVTDASCAPGACPVAASLIALLAAAGSALGVGVVVVLMIRSMSEWREMQDREIMVDGTDRDAGDGPPPPPTC